MIPTIPKHILKQYPINALYLFGSRAKGNESAHSDYDFAVQLDDAVDPKGYYDQRVAIISLLMQYVDSARVDVIILNDAIVPLLLKYNIIHDGHMFYEKNKHARVILESTIMRNWFDEEYFERLWHTIFIKNLAEGRIL